MAREVEAIDITDNEALRTLAREVHESGQPQVLRENGKDVAKVLPLKPSKRKPRDPEAAYQAFLSTAGAWKDHIDLDQFLKDKRVSRDMSSRPPLEL